jgi:hypothetical protein
MNKLIFKLLLVICCFCTTWANSQTLVGPITITLPTNPPANTADWATTMPPLMILAQGKMENGRVNGMVQDSKILVTIKSGGGKVCGSYTPQTAPQSNFNTATKSWSGANVLSLLGQGCVLKPGSYELCVQFYGSNPTSSNVVIGESCKPFTIKENTKETFSPPQNVQPADGKVLTEKEGKAPLTFRWVPVLPKPKEPVTYRLKVWQLMQGQSGAQAMKANNPIIEKEVKDQTQFVKPNLMGDVEMLQSDKGKQADLVWNVEAVDLKGKTLGISEPTTFGVSTSACQYNFKLTVNSVECIGQQNGLNNYKVCINSFFQSANTNLTYTSTGSGISVTHPSYTPIYAVSSITPSLTAQNSGGTGTNKTYCFNVAVPAGQTSIIVGLQGDDNNPSPTITCQPGADTLIQLPSCKCNTCDEKNIGWEIQSQLYYDSTSTNNLLTLHNDIAVNPLLKVVKLSAEIVDFYWYTEGDCKKCNNNDFYWGNITSGSIKGNKFVPQGTSVADETGVPLTSSHQLDFISSSPTGTNLSADTWLNISLPPQTALSCCTDCFRFCVRYTITFMENGVCKTCSIVKCYETKRKHRKIFKKPFLQLQINDCGESPVHHGGGAVLTDGIKQN